MIHGVNPWGMAHWRRQNESNVDLNCTWGRDELAEVPANVGYVALHPALVPHGDAPPTPESLLDVTRAMIEEHGYQWVKSAVSAGQYSHAYGLYFGGDRTEESNRLLAEIVAPRLAGAEEVLVVDLHTGHGAFGTYTLLSPVPERHPDDGWLRRCSTAIASSALGQPTRRPGSSTARSRSARLARARSDLAHGDPELGIISDTRMILNERAEHWVHLHGDRSDPDHARIVWDHRCGSTPDDAEWERLARRHGVEVLDAARCPFLGPSRSE